MWEGLINEDSFKVSSDYMEILIQEPKMKFIWYLPEILGSYVRYELFSEIWCPLEDLVSTKDSLLN